MKGNSSKLGDQYRKALVFLKYRKNVIFSACSQSKSHKNDKLPINIHLLGTKDLALVQTTIFSLTNTFRLETAFSGAISPFPVIPFEPLHRRRAEMANLSLFLANGRILPLNKALDRLEIVIRSGRASDALRGSDWESYWTCGCETEHLEELLVG